MIHRGQNVCTGHIHVLREPCVEASRDAFGLWHATDPRRFLHRPFAFGDGKLAEQEETFARRGGDPIRIAAASVQERGLSRLRRGFGKVDQLVLDLEWAQSLEFL
jgi:hypothetical protein